MRKEKERLGLLVRRREKCREALDCNGGKRAGRRGARKVTCSPRGPVALGFRTTVGPTYRVNHPHDLGGGMPQTCDIDAAAIWSLGGLGKRRRSFVSPIIPHGPGR